MLVILLELLFHQPYLHGSYVNNLSILVIKRSMQLISRVGSISKWPPQWIYYVINVHSSYEEARFTFPKLYQIVLSVANTIEIANTC